MFARLALGWCFLCCFGSKLLIFLEDMLAEGLDFIGIKS